MKSRADLIRECEDPTVVYGHLETVIAERQALALEGIEDALNRAATPTISPTAAGRWQRVDKATGIEVVGNGVFLVVEGKTPGDTASKLVELLNRHWSE